ncbi:phosphatase RsbU N-terminal domain-containing protein [Terrabacter terrigena]|uniref:Phosphatase RsbU N-terminal domain-containing protein n=1 Tax=Terrabacter terrigena TaxID=574718 RepID=A0ABW3MRS4_9MICO
MTASPDRTVLGDLTQDYRTTLLRFLPHHDEGARATAYELGRRAVAAEISLLEVCRLHHQATLEVLRDTAPDEVVDILEGATELLLEVLAAYDMTQRGVLGP